MICALITDGPAEGLEYHFVAADSPPDEIVLGQPGGASAPWTRLIGSLQEDPDFNPHFYVLTADTPSAVMPDGEPCFEYALRQAT